MARETVTKKKTAVLIEICSFCMHSSNKCNVMISSPTLSKEQRVRAYICDYCVEECINLLIQRRNFVFKDHIVQPKQRKQG